MIVLRLMRNEQLDKRRPSQSRPTVKGITRLCRTPYFLAARRLISRLLEMSAPAAATAWRKLRPQAVNISNKIDALKLNYVVEGAGNRASVISFKDALGDCALLAACFVSATSSEFREPLVKKLGLDSHRPFRIVWHETLLAQFTCCLMITFIGSIVALALPQNPMDLRTVLYSWIIPNVTPVLLSYVVLFASSFNFHDGEGEFRHVQVTKLIWAFLFAYAASLSFNIWWLFASVSLPLEPLCEEAAILAYGSVAAAAIAVVAQRWASRQNACLGISKIILTGFFLLALSVSVNAATAQTYMTHDERIRLIYKIVLANSLQPHWLELTAGIPGLIVASLFAGTILSRGTRSMKETELGGESTAGTNSSLKEQS